MIINFFLINKKGNQAPTDGAATKLAAGSAIKSAKQELEEKFPQLKQIEENVATIAKDLMKTFFNTKQKRAAEDDEEGDEAEDDLTDEKSNDADDFVDALLDLLEEFEIMETTETTQ